jgi:MFS family permease
VLAALVVADTGYAFLQTAIIPAIPTVRHALGMSEAFSAWLLSAYLMLATVATPALGRLADLYGRRNLLLVSLLTFFVGAAGAALAPGTPALLIFRATQGAGGAVFPLTFALVREHLPDARVPGAIGTLTGSFGVGTALGFGVGGLIAELVSWRLIFGVGAVAVLGGTVLVWGVVPRRRPGGRGRFDLAGALLVGLAAVALLLALTVGPLFGWGTPETIGLFVVSVAAFAGWVPHELSAQDPLIDLRVFRARSVVIANIATVGLGWALFGTYLLLPELVRAVPGQAGYGFSANATASGLYLLPVAIGQIIAGPLAGRLERHVSTSRIFGTGMVLLTAAVAVLASTQTGLVRLVVAMFVLGLGAGLGIQTSSALVTRDVDAGQTGISSTLNSTIRRFAGGVGSQVSVAILAALPLAGSGHSPHAAFTAAFVVVAVLAALGAIAVLATTGKPAARSSGR